MNKEVIIVVPLYKEEIDPVTEFSICSLFKYLESYRSVCFVYSNRLNINNYKILVSTMSNDTNIQWLAKDAYFFNSTKTYSQLLRTHEFWKEFSKYEYVMIYQTDCMLIRDDLSNWISMDYDYIGAPILGYGSQWKNVPCVGNGGLSLRKVSTFLYITDPNGEFMNEFEQDINNACTEFPEYADYEDLYFADLIPSLWCGFKKPNYKLAAKFAFDRNPDEAFMINSCLPDGIHWFYKYTEFYNNILEDKIPDIVVEYINNK